MYFLQFLVIKTLDPDPGSLEILDPDQWYQVPTIIFLPLIIN